MLRRRSDADIVIRLVWCGTDLIVRRQDMTITFLNRRDRPGPARIPHYTPIHTQAGPDRTGQDRTGPDRTGQDRTGPEENTSDPTHLKKNRTE